MKGSVEPDPGPTDLLMPMERPNKPTKPQSGIEAGTEWQKKLDEVVDRTNFKRQPRNDLEPVPN